MASISHIELTFSKSLDGSPFCKSWYKKKSKNHKKKLKIMYEKVTWLLGKAWTGVRFVIVGAGIVEMERFALFENQIRENCAKAALDKAIIRVENNPDFQNIILEWIENDPKCQRVVIDQFGRWLTDYPIFRMKVVEFIKNLNQEESIEVVLKNSIEIEKNYNKIFLFLGVFIGAFSFCLCLSISVTFQTRYVQAKLIDTTLVESNVVSSYNFLDFFNLNPSLKRKGDLDPFIGFDETSYHDLI